MAAASEALASAVSVALGLLRIGGTPNSCTLQVRNVQM
jgi:hypothetical protein